ncbi:MAG: hypothetical protein Q7S53_05415 [bacterium]|nr:hypothetical protein [bacterium]
MIFSKEVYGQMVSCDYRRQSEDKVNEDLKIMLSERSSEFIFSNLSELKSDTLSPP